MGTDNIVYYTGIGSRGTPHFVLVAMSAIAMYLESCPHRRYCLRSGGADGADLAFENGVIDRENKEIYLPWRGFNESDSQRFQIPKEAFEIASRHHPAWDKLKDSVRRLMARNVQQVLGQDLNKPSAFVICWTPDGCEHSNTRTSKTGGTGLAISVASEFNIPVYNLKHHERSFFSFIDMIVNEKGKQHGTAGSNSQA